VTTAGYSPDGLPRRIVCAADGAELVLVAGSVSLLGADDGPPETRPQLEIHLGDFYIGATEVTLEQYDRYLRDRRTQVVRRLEEPLNQGAPADHPALGLSWGAARDYARWAGQELPTEAQWEKAARGPTGFDHPWGNGRTVFHRSRTQSQIDPVGSFPLDRSPFGALDLAGNAREWCLDFYSERAFAEAAGSGASPLTEWQGPRRPSAESHRVIKGNGPDWKVWQREGLSMAARRPDVGFRCVLELERVAESAEQPDAASESDSNPSPMRGSRSRRRP
jgi:formylglycine-generating enzyme required for sulfatase activity